MKVAQATVIDKKADTLEAQLVAPAVAVAKYNTLPLNRPQTYHNLVAIAPGPYAPWAREPLASQRIQKDDPTGDVTLPFSGSGPPYVVAYGTSPTGTAYCATIQVTELNEWGTPFNTSLDLAWVGSDSLVAKFTTPTGNQPHTYKNWLGLWIGEVAYFNDTNRKELVRIESNVSTDYQTMNGLTLLHSTKYTLGYGSGPADTDLSTTLTFETDPFLYTFRQFRRRFGDAAIDPVVRKMLSRRN